MEPQSSGIKAWQWVVTVIVIIVLIVIGVMVFGNKGSQTAGTENPTATTTDNTGTTPINRVTMTDQYPGNVVYLSSVQADKPAWVVVQTDSNGTPGKVIGSVHVDAGINPGKVTLTQPMVDGATYYASMYSDDGSGKFDINADKVLMDANGSAITHVFKASTSVGAGLKG